MLALKSVPVGRLASTGPSAREVTRAGFIFIGVFFAFFLALMAGPASADNYPSRPIRVFTTSSAGGISDIFMRVLERRAAKRLGQPLIIENKPGGAGNIAARLCQDAPPDGYTICIINADTMIYNQFLFKSIPFDPEKLTPIVNLFHLIQVLVVNSDLNVKTVDELVAVSKAKPGTLNYLTASIPCVVYMDSLKRDKGADWVRVPFSGGGEAVTAILGGTTPIGLIGLGNVIAQIKAGKMTALALVNNIRTPLLPDVPTLGRPRLQGRAVGDLVRAVRAAGHAEGDHRQAQQRDRATWSAIPRSARNTSSAAAWCRRSTRRRISPRDIKAGRAGAEQVVKESGLEPQ